MFETLNGRAVSWAEIGITINVLGGVTAPTIDIKSIDHESTVDVGEQRGASGGQVIKQTTGQGSYSASATFYRDGMRDLKKALLAAATTAGFVNRRGQVQLSKVRFDVVITHDWEDDPEIYVVKLLGCRVTKDSGKHAEGTDPETVDIDLKPLSIVEIINGVETVLL